MGVGSRVVWVYWEYRTAIVRPLGSVLRYWNIALLSHRDGPCLLSWELLF
jgi:hypothetical protein